MAGLFKQRRPKRIVPSASASAADDDEEEDSGPVVRRPGALKQKSRLRVAFDPDADADSEQGPDDVSQKTATAGRPSAIRPSTAAALRDRLRETRIRDGDDEHDDGHSRERGNGNDNHDHDHDTLRPSYSKSYLDELRNSTPSTPRDLITITPPSEQQLDVASKFPRSTAADVTSNKIHVLTASEIAAAKAWRARLAQEQKAEADGFIPLDDNDLYDSDGEFKPQRLQVGSYSQSNHALAQAERGTRLEHEDEDFMEGFDSFVEANTTSSDPNNGTRVQMDVSRRAERQRRKAEREAMRAQITAAEHGDGDSDGDDDAASGSSAYDSDDGERHRAYEAAQFHAGLDGLGRVHDEHTRRSRRPRQPRVTTPIDRLAVGLDRLRQQVERLQVERQQLGRRQAAIAAERADLADQRAHVQRALDETSAELERMQQANPAGRTSSTPPPRGLDSMGS